MAELAGASAGRAQRSVAGARARPAVVRGTPHRAQHGDRAAEPRRHQARSSYIGVALLPRRCAITEIASKRLVAVQVTGVSRKRQVTLVCRKAHRSHAADAFLKMAQEHTANLNI
jgi:DNA-binding transcriptional LysR family regulator